MIFIVRLLCGHAAVAINATTTTATRIAAKRARLSPCIWFLPIGPNADAVAAKSYTADRRGGIGRFAGAWHMAAPGHHRRPVPSTLRKRSIAAAVSRDR